MTSTSGRLDGRGFEEFRPFFINTNVISQARGSAYAEFSNTKIMAGVYGPRQSERKFGFSERGRLHCDVRLAAFAAQGLTKQQQVTHERNLSEALQNALSASVQLQKIPKSSVDVFVMVLESGGADLAVAITAASVALADTGIELFDIVPACQVIKRGGVIYLDPTAAEEEGKEASLLLAYMPSLSEVTQLDIQGCWGDSELKETIELCMGACVQLKTSMQDALILSVENTKSEV
ncbi:hypothetical protein CEUSTIGMA_g2635.t1 [Chlamydomonas eustigma]|uniref:Exoribonuclease phosphorolytic domain-containing protein n=1 Tax=Chlamydomonas eustigma TaxID=1157962 RepID=A0A250WWK0_9CHLO|nr:hypothetical protein CEUSTIGMA_g2635.t1 [Chlamydomonas eustigma]|eukprot:GAX75191.1 hypothetical protein CEUSTIGMA_g2635.t1 [Chlamydomonas eustigma]